MLIAELPGPYTEHSARRFTRTALIPGELLERDHIDIRRAAAALRIPERELAAALAEGPIITRHGAGATVAACTARCLSANQQSNKSADELSIRRAS